MTGSVWEACEQLGTLPKDNLQAVNKKLQKDELLVMDALQEVEEVTFNRTELLAILHLKFELIVESNKFN